MILCHKCSGVLAYEKTEFTTGLLGCQCISGYVRGFEPKVFRSEAIQRQIKRQYDWIELYTQQGRSTAEIQVIWDRIERLKAEE